MELISEKYEKISKSFAKFYCLFGVVMTVYNSIYSTPYYIFLSASSLLFLILPWLLRIVLNMKKDYLLDFIIMAYAFLTFMIGMVFNGYSRIIYYDKIMHTLTGVIFGLSGVIFFYLLNPSHKPERKDCAIVSWFSVSFAMLVAVLWEILEYIINFVLHNDPQKTAATGVNDTMIDIIVCLIGALLLCISIYRYYKKDKTDFPMKLFVSFRQTNQIIK